MHTTLNICCVGNTEWNGTWTKNEVEQEMRELEIQPTENDWIEWILDHAIGLLDQQQMDFIADDATVAVSLKVDGLLISITKK